MIDLSGWPALVLCAGIATRLRPLSNVRAKAAVPVAGRPLISRILQWLSQAGVRRVVINLHHRPETVTHIVGDGSSWNLSVRYSWEPVVLGSAGGPKRALPLLDSDRFLIVNGDTLTDCNLQALVDQHLATQPLVTMAVIEKDVERVALVDADGVVLGFGSRSQQPIAARAADPWHFIGVQAADVKAFDSVPENVFCETVKELYPRLIAEQVGSVRAFRSSAEFLDIGTPADYLSTVDIVAGREGKALDIGHDTQIDPSARVVHSILWDNVRVSARARLVDCIVADNVFIPEDSQYARSTIVSDGDRTSVRPFG